MKKRKNAFTLIELLAVIIILAAIALIIAPLVLDIIKEQQMKTFKESINGILRSSRLEIVNSGLKFPVTFTYSDGKLLSPAGKELKVTGKIPEGTGSVRYNSEDNIELAITDNTWCGTYNKTSKEVEVNAFNGICEVAIAYTPEKCFQVENDSEKVYTINQAQCITYFTAKSREAIPSDAQEICSGIPADRLYGATLQEAILIGMYSEEELISNGVITIQINQKEGVKVTKYNKSDSDCGVDVVIPETIGGKTVKAIGQAAFLENWDGDWNNDPTVGDAKKINSVVFPSGLEKIEVIAFAGQYNDTIIFNQINKLDFSKANNLTTIGGASFAGNQLTNVDLSNLTNLTAIGAEAFMGNQLTNVDLSNLTNLTTIGGASFAWNQLTNVTFGAINKLESIGKEAFCNIDGRNTLPNFDNIPTSVTSNNTIRCLAQ